MAELGNLGNLIGDVTNQILNLKRNTDYHNESSSLLLELDSLTKQHEQGQEIDVGVFETEAQALRAEHIDQIKDGVTARAVNQTYTTALRHKIIGLRESARRKEVELAIVSLGQNLERYEQLARETTTDAEYSLITDMAKAKINSGIGKFYDKAAANKLEDTFMQRVETNEVREEIMYGNPQSALDDLKNSEMYQNIPEDQQIALEKEAQAKIKSNEVAVRIKENELKQQLKDKIKALKEIDQRQVGDLYMAGKFTEAYKAAQNSEHLTGTQKREWANAITSATKADDPFGNTDYDYFFEQLQKAQDGEINSEDIIPLPNRLSRQDAGEVRAAADRYKKGIEDPDEKVALAMEKELLKYVQARAKQGSSFFGYTIESQEDAYMAWSAIKLALSAEPDPRKRIEMADPSSPNYIGDKVAGQYFKKSGGLQDAADLIDILRDVDKKKPPPEPEPGQEPPTFTHYSEDPKTGEKEGWNGKEWVPIPNK